MKNCQRFRQLLSRGAGFTLIELMVVVAIVGILAVLAYPQLRIVLYEGHLQEAKPYLMRIAAAQRTYFNRRGEYFPSGNSNIDDEQDIEDTLGVDLSEAADFCFVIVRKTSNFVSNSGSPDFEVWALLRNSSSTGNDAVALEGSGPDCTTADEKNASTGWVQDAGSTAGVGRIVVLRYPAPTDGIDTATDTHRGAAIQHDWISGISIFDALL